jgi:uncharacterized surface protein with fasciclin (FAS1) repeats
MATLRRIPQPSAGHIDHVGLATLLRGALTSPNTAISLTALFLALKEMSSRPVDAPADGTFSRLLSQTVADLLLPGNEAKLASILRYHAVVSQVQARHAESTSLHASL